MADIVGVKFENSPKIYGFRKDGVEVKKGDRVVVESELGVSLGRVEVTDCPMDDPTREVKPLLRKATEEDLEKERENVKLKEEARAFCNERIMARGLPMRLVATEITLDRKRYIFYFTADNRIDFRELVKDLASKFRTRIELRQIGVRDAASIVGGLGICGREFCCKTFLKSFYPISIKMAKQQDLVLNTAKLSGTCGRLMCCLNYEYVKPGDRKRMEERASETCITEEAEPETVAVTEEVRETVEELPETVEELPETVEELPETVEEVVETAPEQPKKAEGPEGGEVTPRPEAEQKPEEKRRRKRRGRRRRHKKSPQGEQQTQTSPRPEPQAHGTPKAEPRAQAPSAPSGEQSDKPKEGEGQGKRSRRSRRRWRPKKKK